MRTSAVSMAADRRVTGERKSWASAPETAPSSATSAAMRSAMRFIWRRK
jgi:hypothetical protein